MKLDNPKIDEIIKIAGLAKVKLTDGNIEIFLKTDLIGTYSSIPGGVRFTYPEGGEYTHTSMWGKELTDDFIRTQMWRIAVESLNADYRKFSTIDS